MKIILQRARDVNGLTVHCRILSTDRGNSVLVALSRLILPPSRGRAYMPCSKPLIKIAKWRKRNFRIRLTMAVE